MTPRKAIRNFCLFCAHGQSVEVTKCPSTDCLFYQYRFHGKIPKIKPEHTSLKSIRLKCLDCGETAHGVKTCPHEDCSLFEYRLGKNPRLTGVFRGERCLKVLGHQKGGDPS